MIRVTLYSKPGCHLCEVVEQTISFVRTRRPFDFEKRNIADDPADFQRYQYEIPVICVNGTEIARHQLTAAALERALDQAEG
jgi:glutaredoxin